MRTCPDRAAALALLQKYNQEPFHIQHALTVEGVMRWYANELGHESILSFTQSHTSNAEAACKNQRIFRSTL